MLISVNIYYLQWSNYQHFSDSVLISSTTMDCLRDLLYQFWLDDNGTISHYYFVDFPIKNKNLSTYFFACIKIKLFYERLLQTYTPWRCLTNSTSVYRRNERWTYTYTAHYSKPSCNISRNPQVNTKQFIVWDRVSQKQFWKRMSLTSKFSFWLFDNKYKTSSYILG